MNSLSLKEIEIINTEKRKIHQIGCNYFNVFLDYGISNLIIYANIASCLK